MFGKSKKNAEITYIAAGCTITGETEFIGNALIGGTIFGKVVAEQNVTIEPKGSIDGQLACQELKVSGIFKGKLQCERLIITSSGTVEGEVASKTMEIFEGGQFIGVRVKEEMNLLQDLKSENKLNKNNLFEGLELQSE
ncbi:polymer-forming cytoskeletal protein [Shewanella yunxiaonensis]|uniref:Polymer-forming cytoskeletal protein n=1 Tax=Shewanella yunxiaonensis TaxID=2829809 RepID=A0ABX7YXF4_9GAMM|nr:polymer-forming cytoskeletal protein [Shewanella yunxiaonensis]QUN06964.1 polymer-forming cytoskeletal protein [Shewanella yunxiaonensis]